VWTKIKLLRAGEGVHSFRGKKYSAKFSWQQMSLLSLKIQYSIVACSQTIGKFFILRYDKIKYYSQNAQNRKRENPAKLHVKNLPNLFWPRNPPNRRGSVEKQ
jgi:hypothetical protein